MGYIEEVCQQTQTAAKSLYSSSSIERNQFLTILCEELKNNQDEIIVANAKDIAEAKKNQLNSALIDRLTLTPTRIAALVQGVEEIRQLPEPLGEIKNGKTLANGLTLYQESVPLGVVLVIYESRPNVTIDIAALSIKSGNGLILRGGKEALNSNLFLGKLVQQALTKAKFPQNSVTVIEKTDRDLVDVLLQQNQYIDIVVPRGGHALIERVSSKSSIPVIKHDKGLCHIFLDENYSKEEAIKIILNAKTQRPGVCNALETLLIHKNVQYKKEIFTALQKEKVEIRLDEKLFSEFSGYSLATVQDWEEEYLDLILSIKEVEDVKEATSWISRYGSGHSDAILSYHTPTIRYFKQKVDSACVLVNCSTRFHDGGMFGLGAEVGISTQKLHVRGPMGLQHLTCLKYIVEGQGQVRE